MTFSCVFFNCVWFKDTIRKQVAKWKRISISRQDKCALFERQEKTCMHIYSTPMCITCLHKLYFPLIFYPRLLRPSSGLPSSNVMSDRLVLQAQYFLLTVTQVVRVACLRTFNDAKDMSLRVMPRTNVTRDE